MGLIWGVPNFVCSGFSGRMAVLLPIGGVGRERTRRVVTGNWSKRIYDAAAIVNYVVQIWRYYRLRVAWFVELPKARYLSLTRLRYVIEFSISDI